MNQIPVYCLTGCLGSGKTTLLNHLASQVDLTARRTALIVNEFGQIGFDGRQVEGVSFPLLELNRGSVFCSCIQPDVLAVFETLVDTIRPDQVLVEASGLASPIDLAKWFTLRNLDQRLKIAAHVCVVDAMNFTKVAPFLQSALRQVMTADGLVVNKCDLVSQAEQARFADWLATLNPRADQIVTQHGQIPWSFITQLRHQPPTDAADGPPAEISAWSCLVDRVDRNGLQQAIQRLADRLLRLKGFLNFGDGTRQVDVVFGSYTEKPSGDRSPCGMTAIGWRISAEELRDHLAPACREGFRSAQAVIVEPPRRP
jgi:G3E family GTPase